MDSMTFEEAQKLLHRTPWKTVPCGSEGCWCLMVLPASPILYGNNEEMYVSGGGGLSKDIAEYIVRLHNERLEREKCCEKERKNMEGRYYYIDESESSHCCFSHTVLDREERDSVCECFDESCAELIRDALNRVPVLEEFVKKCKKVVDKLDNNDPDTATSWLKVALNEVCGKIEYPLK